MRVSKYMSRPVITVTPQTEFHRAFDLMRARGIHHLPVVDGDRVVGVLAERDVLLAAANFGPAEVPVSEIMHSPAVCVVDSTELKDAARVLVEKHIGSLPVLDDSGALVGMITETDIFKIAAGMLHARPETKRPARKTGKSAAGKAAGRTVAKTAAKKAVAKSAKPAKKAAAKVAKKAPVKAPKASTARKAAPKKAKAGAARKTAR